MDGSVEVSAVRSGLLDEKFVARASTSFGRGQANLLYRVLLAVAQNDAAQLAACKRDPIFQELLMKALSARDRCEDRKVGRKRVALTDAMNRRVDASILRIVKSGAWTTKREGLRAVCLETAASPTHAFNRYTGLVEAGVIRYSQSLRRALIVDGEPSGPRTE